MDHDNKCTDGDEKYWEKRRPTGQDEKLLQKTIKQLWYQRNYLSCAADLGP